jgi:hypothetical protein
MRKTDSELMPLQHIRCFIMSFCFNTHHAFVFNLPRGLKKDKVEVFFFPVPVCAITPSGVPSGTFVSMNRFSTLCG